jgi:hypothetical protein
LHAGFSPPGTEGHRLRQIQILDQPLERARIPLLLRWRGSASCAPASWMCPSGGY